METRKAIALSVFVVLGFAMIAMPAVSAMHNTVYVNGYVIFRNGERASATLTLFEQPCELNEHPSALLYGSIYCGDYYGSFYFSSNSYTQYRNFIMINAAGAPHNDFGGSGSPLTILIYHKSPFLFLAYGPDFVFVGKGYFSIV